MVKKSRIIVTGVNGFIGSNLLLSLLDKYIVIGIDRNISPISHPNYIHIKSDLNDLSFLESLVELNTSFDCVIHLAAINDKGNSRESFLEMINTNTVSTLNLLDWANDLQIPHFIYISTGSVYGFGKDMFNEDNEIGMPNNVYSMTKSLSELIVTTYSKSIKTTIIRPFFPYGPGMKPSFMLHRLINTIRANEVVNLNMDGKPCINPIYIDDLIKGIILLMEGKGSYRVYNLCGEQIVSIKELSGLISTELGVNLSYVYNDEKLEDLLGSNSKIKNDLFWRPNFSLEQGIKKTIKWYKSL